MADVQLDALENRIQPLEKLVFGSADKDALYPREKKLKAECIESLTSIQKSLANAVAGKKKIAQVHDRVPALKKFLDPAYTDEMTLSDSAKADTVIAEEDFLQHQAVRLQKIDELKDIIDSEHIKAVPSHSSKLQELSRIQISQQDQTAELTEETRKLLAAYNSIASLVSKQFVQWDEILTKLEIQSQPRKQLD